MNDLTPDEILGGLRALVQRSEIEADAAEAPLPVSREGPPAPMAAPAMPHFARRPANLKVANAANGLKEPVTLKGRG